MQDSDPLRVKSLHSLWTALGRVNRHQRRVRIVRRADTFQHSLWTPLGRVNRHRRRSRSTPRSAAKRCVSALPTAAKRKRARPRAYSEVRRLNSTRGKSRALKTARALKTRRGYACISRRRMLKPSASTSSFCAKERRKCVSRWLNTFPGMISTLLAIACSTNCVALRLRRLGTSTKP